MQINCFSYKKLLIRAFSLALIGLCLLGVGIAYWFQHPLKNQSTVIFINKGASLTQISTQLHSQKVLSFPYLFKLILYGTGGWRHLKAGEYLLPPSVSPSQLIYILKSGNVILHPVTLIEGETSHHLTQRLLADPRFQGTCSIPPEGSLLPETYAFPRNTQRQKILDHMQKAMKAALTEEWFKRAPNLPLKSPEELLIMASIVEKETSRSQEKPLVAAVFINRLKQGMPLQADPTIIYGLTQGKADLGRVLTTQDLRTDSLFNTYLYPGLPPSPITNPSLSSLKAVASPADTPYLYFVADGSGGHVFAANLKEHQKNHAAWRKVKQEEKNSGSHKGN